jgi:hypothetical protein
MPSINSIPANQPVSYGSKKDSNIKGKIAGGATGLLAAQTVRPYLAPRILANLTPTQHLGNNIIRYQNALRGVLQEAGLKNYVKGNIDQSIIQKYKPELDKALRAIKDNYKKLPKGGRAVVTVIPLAITLALIALGAKAGSKIQSALKKKE